MQTTIRIGDAFQEQPQRQMPGPARDTLVQSKGLPIALPFAALLLWLATTTASAQGYRILHQFTNYWGQEYPNADLVLSGDTLYGTTGGFTGRGRIYQISTNGSDYVVLRSDLENNGASAGLVVSGTMLYGTTINDGCCGYGTVFKVQTDGGGYTVLNEFHGPDGAQSYGGLVLSDGILYGTTRGGGDSNAGTVFMLPTNGSSHTVLKHFTHADGAEPFARLVLSGQTLYGTTWYGGAFDYGTVFKVQTDGSGYRVLKSFHGYAEGSLPFAGLALSGTTLFGTTAGGGSSGKGTVFQVNCDGSDFRVLKSFTGADGAGPFGNLIVSGTTLIGTTSEGGAANLGTVFALQTDGSAFAVLRSFAGDDGANPRLGGLLLADCTLYGTTASGGVSNCGVVFRLPLLPEATVVPASQTAEAGFTATFRLRPSGWATSYQWLFNGTNLLGTAKTNPVLRLPNLDSNQAGAYAAIVTNVFGSVTSAPAILGIIPPVDRRPVPGLSLIGPVGSVINLDTSACVFPASNWMTLDTVPLNQSPQWYFDLTSPLPPQAFYRAWRGGTKSPVPALALHIIPALTLTGAIGSTVRVDAINQTGPTDAWFTLAAVTLTNTSQLYFDTDAVGQPARLYRLLHDP